MSARLRPELADLPAYTPGRTVPGAIKIASNETVDGPLPSVKAAIAQAVDTLPRERPRDRVRAAITLVAASPEYLVQK